MGEIKESSGKFIAVPSTKFWTSIIVAICITIIQGHLQYLGEFEFTKWYLGIMAGIAGVYGGLKTIQNSILTKKDLS